MKNEMTWKKLNDLLRSADEKACLKLLEQERGSRRRRQYLLRIHSRLNKVRADRERAALVKAAS